MERKEVVRRDIGFCFGEFMGGSGVYIGRRRRYRHVHVRYLFTTRFAHFDGGNSGHGLRDGVKNGKRWGGQGGRSGAHALGGVFLFLFFGFGLERTRYLKNVQNKAVCCCCCLLSGTTTLSSCSMRLLVSCSRVAVADGWTTRI